MKIRRVKKGKNLFWPIPLNYTNKLEYNIYFNATAIYDLKSDDQHDWNKLAGLNFAPFKTRSEFVMIGFRWYRGALELAPYYHIESIGLSRILPKDEDVYKVDWERDFMNGYTFAVVRVVIENTGDLYRVRINNKEYKQRHGHGRLNGFEVPTWFGGSLPAPQIIKIGFEKA